MSAKVNPALAHPEIRRMFEEEFLLGEATDTIAALIDALGISQRELAERLGVSPGRVSQILSGDENLTLRSLAALGWALGVRFGLDPMPMADRSATPASNDLSAPAWLSRLGQRSTAQFRRITHRVERRPMRAQFHVVSGEVKAA